MRVWGVVYAANMVGAAAFAALASLMGPALGSLIYTSFALLHERKVAACWPNKGAISAF